MRGEVPKPLIQILGMRLIERAILALEAAGVRRFVVVTGAHTDEISRELPKLRRLDGKLIEQVHCATWEHGNGHSLACGAAAAGEAFYLVMADHVFDPAIVRRLGDAAEARPDDIHLATDGDVAAVFDLDDATKVSAVEQTITAIGKDLDTYDRIDVGLFACPRSMAVTAPAAIAAGANSVSDVMRSAIARRQMRSVPIDGLLWQDVDNADMRREAERRLLRSARKPTDGPISRWFNRPVSLALTRVMAQLHVTPNQITTLVFALGIVAAILIARGDWPSLIVAGILVQLASIVDGSDGELARVAIRGSRFGAWYDTLTDNLRFAGMVAACAIGLYLRDPHVGYLIAGGAFVAGAVYLVAVMTSHLRSTGSAGTHLVIVAKVESDAAKGGAALWRFLYWLRPLVKQDVLAFVAAILLVLNLPLVILVGGLVAVAAMILAVDRALERDGRGMRFMTGVAGLSLLAWLIVTMPVDQIATAIRSVGWPVLLAIPIVLAWMLANTIGLHSLLGGRVGLGALLHNRMIGDGYNAIVPAAGVGGEPVRIALLRSRIPALDAATAVITDRIINLAAGLVVSASALAISMVLLELPRELVAGATIYSVLAGLATVALLVMLRGGASERVIALAGRLIGGSAMQPSRIPARAILGALGWNIFGRVLAGLEVALYGSLLGLQLSVTEIVFVTGVLHAVGAAMFVVPQGIGVAEAAAVYALHVLGYPPELGLAFGLLRRARLLAFSATAVGMHLAGRRWVAPRALRIESA